MHEEMARLAHPVINYALKIKDRLERGEDVTPERTFTELERLLSPTSGLKIKDRPELGEDVASERTFAEPERLLSPTSGARSASDREKDVRYAMTCWVDELFILHSPWRQRWNEAKLEFQLFRSNDRARRFWDLADRSLAAGDVHMVEVLLLCVALGFRGDRANDPPALATWTESARRLIEAEMARDWVTPPAREPRIAVTPLPARGRFATAAARAGVLALVVLPIVVLFLMFRLGD